MKRLLFFSVMLFAALVAQGQRFEWAKGYDSGYEDAYIKGTVTDSLGNLYILGQIHYDSDWGNEWLMPYLTTTNTMVLVAKISPDGEMVWKKVFGNTGNPTFAFDIIPLGDTGFAVMFWDSRINLGYEMRYWGDSLCNNVQHPLASFYDTPGRRFEDGPIDIYMSFDFEGNVTEQHALEISYVDINGNEYEYRYSQNTDSLPWLKMSFMAGATFDVDNDGNIYVCFYPGDYPHPLLYANADSLAAIRYWIDHRLVGESNIYDNSDSAQWRRQLVKFSPHFDTVLASRYVVQKGDASAAEVRTKIRWNNEPSRLYTIVYIGNVFDSCLTITVDSVLNFTIQICPHRPYKSFLVVYDENLNPNKLIEFRDSVTNTSNPHLANTIWVNMAFDNDSDLLAISGAVWNPNAVFTYNNNIVPINFINSNAVVLLFDKTDYTLHSVMEFPSTGLSSISVSKTTGLVIKNNRVFLQAKYKNGITLPSGHYNVQGSTNYGLALAVWDYQGSLIDGRDYHTYSQKHNPGPIALVDSTLYLVNQLCANATFGNQTFYASNSYMACIAKYVDTAFMSVYRPPVGGISSGAESVDYSFYPNPVENLLHVDLEGENILSASAISVLGIKDNLEVVGDAVDVSHLQPGIYIMELTTTHNTYNFKFIKR